jgi:hypothetical protein
MTVGLQERLLDRQLREDGFAIVPVASTLNALEQSNLPQSKKSSLRRMVEKAFSQDQIVTAQKHAHHGMGILRQGGEAVGTAAFLLWMQSMREKGLDTPFGPIDGWLAAAGILGSFIAPDSLKQDALNVGTHALAIATFRKGEAVKEHFTGHASPSAHGDDIEETILNAAKSMGF